MATSNEISVEQQKAGLFATPDYSPYYQGNQVNDDNPPASNTTTEQSANDASNINGNGDITPQSNVLDNFASNTWTASVYLLSPVQYT
jgi:hypothetical protein